MLRFLFVCVFVAGSLSLILFVRRRCNGKKRKTHLRYSESYESLAREIADIAQAKLGRQLDRTEQNSIRRAPSLMTLEMFALQINCSDTDADVANALSEFSTLYESHLVDIKSQIRSELIDCLGRSLSPDELFMVESVSNMSEAMKWLDDIKDDIDTIFTSK